MTIDTEIRLAAELATLKRQHEQLVAAAEQVEQHFYCRNTNRQDTTYLEGWALSQCLRAALDAPPAEPETHPVSKQASEPICYECKNSADQRFCRFCS